MLLKHISVGQLATNAYFYIDETSQHGFLIDPGDDAERLLALINSHHWTIEKILLTHGHFDHIGAVQFLYHQLHIPYFIHLAGARLLTEPTANLSSLYSTQPIILKGAHYLADNALIQLAANPLVTIKILHTPGHTADSAIYYDANNQLAFVGDTIFHNSVGNTAFPTSNAQALQTSVAKICHLPSNTKLYPGHSISTSVAHERQNHNL